MTYLHAIIKSLITNISYNRVSLNSSLFQLHTKMLDVAPSIVGHEVKTPMRWAMCKELDPTLVRNQKKQS